jgi:predicted PurR-regulated permease PerM
MARGPRSRHNGPVRHDGFLPTDPLIPDPPPMPWWTGRRGRFVLGSLAVFACGWALQLARPLLLPLVLALIIAVVLTPVLRLLRRLRLPAPIASAAVVGAFAAAVAAGVFALADPASHWIERAPQTLSELDSRLRPVKASLFEAQKAAEKVEEMARVDGDHPAPQVSVKEPSLAMRMVGQTQSVLFEAAEVVILVYFLLAFGEAFYRGLVKIPERLRGKVRVVAMVTEIEQEISTLLFTIASINAGLGTATALAMSLLGMPNPLLWGAMAAVFNFVPYLGSTVTLCVLAAVAILTFDTVTRALVVPAVFLALAILEGQFITPIIVGKRMALNPLVIMVGLMVMGWIWGVMGLLITMPVLAILKIYCAHDERLEPLGLLLGPE